MKSYTVRQLGNIAGISVRTLHYYDDIGLLPAQRRRNGYRQYGEEAALRLQQIMFFRELGFSLEDIRDIMSRPDFDVTAALEQHRTLLQKRSERLAALLTTVEKTIKSMKGKRAMTINDYYEGFNDAEVEAYRREVKERWGEKTLEESEARITGMGKEKFAMLQVQGNEIYRAIAANMDKGAESETVQKLVGQWREWLENFSHYSDEAVLGLGRTYSSDPRFAAFYRKIHPELPEFFTRAIEFYCRKK